MSEPLKEKAWCLKLSVGEEEGQSICDLVCCIDISKGIFDFEKCSAKAKEMVVRLEDAQKEIDDLKIKLDSYFMKYKIQAESIVKFEKERLELKQKLRQRYDECKRIEETTASPLWREGARWNMKLIEELLEEEKEAKPT